MAIYAIHSPAFDGDPAKAFERARVIPLGVARWGFVFGPLWLLFKGLWLALGAWALGAVVVGFAISRGALSSEAGDALYWLSALFICIEGRNLQSRALARGGRPLADIVVGASPAEAERGFLARALAAETPSGAAVSRPTVASGSGASHVLGLFPEAGR